MAKEYFLPRNDAAKAIKFTTFRDNVGPYVATFGLVPADVAAQALDASYFTSMRSLATTMVDAGRQWNAWKDIVLTGETGTEPVLPAKPVGFPPSVAAGIVTRFLGLEGAEVAPPDLNTVQPAISALATGGVVKITWGWGGNSAFLDMCEIQVDRGVGNGFVPLAFDTTPNYDDNQPYPAAPAKWTYRATYRVGDHRVGLWSADASVMVG
ncbi:MAG: hypothetical protein RLZZ214_3114 [Verrucomicrobiota bacterium]|jgi:hypothetical protein